MKKCIKLHFFTALFMGVFSLCAQEESSAEQQPLREMTPEQLDESLHIDKQDLDLDQVLKKDLSAEIDSEIPTPSPIAQQAPSKNVSPAPLQKNNIPFPPSAGKETEKVEFQFEDADLQNLLLQISELFQVTFITDDALSPLSKTGRSIKGNKISFKTNEPLTKRQAWNLFLTFLDIAQLAVVAESDPSILRIMPTGAAQRAPIPTYIGVQTSEIPNSEQLIRYAYFVENVSLSTIIGIINSLRSSASALIELKDTNGFILTDKANNIKSLMTIVNELDKVSMPQAMSVLKLRRADALDVQKLYTSITQTDEPNVSARLFPARKQPSNFYFPENARIIAEPRTNSLILLGPPDSIKKIEDFIVRFVDVELGEESRSPLRIYTLKYADAQTVAEIMNQTVQFGKGTPAGQTGGVRNGDKYIKSLTFTAEPSTNQLIIKGDEEDYQQAIGIIAQLDEPQPQVAIEILILGISLIKTKDLGAQLRSKVGGISEGLFGSTVKFQTANIDNVITNPVGAGVQRLLGNLLTLITEPLSTVGQGNTVVTFGSDVHGVWGIFRALDSLSNTQVISNPFLIATNKQTATVSVGENRRVVTNTVVTGSTNQNSFSDLIAALTVKVTPQINSDGMIVLDLDININEFTNPVNQNDATMRKRNITTSTIVSDKEVLALGGLIRNKVDESSAKTPVLANIPILGWFFKDKRKEEEKQNLLILISTQILPSETPQRFTNLTQEHIRDYHGTLTEMQDVIDRRDPIHRFFFAEGQNATEKIVDDFIFDRHTPDKKKKTFVKKSTRKNKAEKIIAAPVKNKVSSDNVVVTQQEASISPATPLVPTTSVTTPPAQAPTRSIKSKHSVTDFLTSSSEKPAC